MVDRDFKAEMAAIWDEPSSNKLGPMVRARHLIEAHVAAYGMIPHPDKLKEEIATIFGLAEIQAADFVAAAKILQTALEDTNSLLAAILLEKRQESEICRQIYENRNAINSFQCGEL